MSCGSSPTALDYINCSAESHPALVTCFVISYKYCSFAGGVCCAAVCPYYDLFTLPHLFHLSYDVCVQVNYFIQHLEKKDTLEPKGFEGQLSDAQIREKKKAAAEARKALAEPPSKPAGRVIVVGAGPAGLAAATQLQVS